jgi:hypothetical protein
MNLNVTTITVTDPDLLAKLSAAQGLDSGHRT